MLHETTNVADVEKPSPNNPTMRRSRQIISAMNEGTSMVSIQALAHLGGHALLQALSEISDKELGHDSALSSAVRGALESTDAFKFEQVQSALRDLSNDTQESILHQAHKKMVLGGFGVLADVTPHQTGETKPTKH